jgi:MFS family permease
VLTSAGAGSPERAMVIGATATVVGSLPVFLTASMAVQLSAELAFGAVGIGAAVGNFFGTMALSSMHLGRLADRLGATLSLRIATIGAALSAFGIAAMARGWLSLAAGLVVAGLAAALAQPAANRLLINRVRGARLGTAFGLKQSAPPTAYTARPWSCSRWASSSPSRRVRWFWPSTSTQPSRPARRSSAPGWSSRERA